VLRGYGFIAPDDSLPESSSSSSEKQSLKCDVFVYQSAIQMSGFRFLREGERVQVWYKRSNRGLEAAKVCGPDGQDCQGAGAKQRKRKRKPYRCYNCNELGHHARECTESPMPKRCHRCKSTEHLFAICPLRKLSSPPNGLQTSNQEKSLPGSHISDES